MKQSIAQYYSKNPKIFFSPETPESEKSAEIAELLVNQRWKKLKMKWLMRNSVKRAKLDGVVGFKTYFNFKKDFVKDVFNDRLYNDEVRTDLVPLSVLLKEPDFSWDKSPWIGHEVEATLSEIYEKFSLKGNDRESVEVVKVNKDFDTSEKFGGGEIHPDYKYGCYVEIEDRKQKKLFYLVKGLDKIVKGPIDADYKFDSMWDFLEYNDLPEVPNAHSDYHFWKDQLREIGIYRTMLANHAKRGNSKYKVMGQKLTEDQKTQLKTSEDTSFVEMQAGQDVTPFQHAQIDQAIFQAESVARQDIQIVSKQAPRQSSGDEKTATEVKAIEMAAREVTSENLERLEEVMSSIANKWNMLMKANYTTERIVSLTEMPQSKFVGYQNSIGDVMQGSSKRPFLKVSSENLSEDVQASIEAGSTQPDNEAQRINKLMGFAKFVSGIPGAAAALDLVELIKEGEEAFGVRNKNLLKPKDNPASENQLLNAGTFVAARISEDHDAHIHVHENDPEGQDSLQKMIHILMHKEFKRQIDVTKEGVQVSQMKNFEAPLSGQSFVGGNSPSPMPQGLPQGAPQGAPAPMVQQPIKQGVI